MGQRNRYFLLLLAGLLISILMKAQKADGYYRQIVKMANGTEACVVPDRSTKVDIYTNDSSRVWFIKFRTSSGVGTFNASLVRSINFDFCIPEERALNSEIETDGRFSIFTEALRRTGLMDSIKNIQPRICNLMVSQDQLSQKLYPVNICRKGFTIFAETDSVMRLQGINNFEDLVSYANQVYGKAEEWYDYINGKDLAISTGDDYTNRLNTLNMFVAYHIVNAAIPANWLVYERENSAYWNYKPDASLYDYYETMLPSTLLKAWQPYPDSRIFLNRYISNNTLTDEIGTTGSASIHQLKREGIEVLRDNRSLTAHNGYVHRIGGMLVYDELVPHGVLNERMRFNCTALMPELRTNGWQQYSYGDLPFDDFATEKVSIPLDYSNSVCFPKESQPSQDDNILINPTKTTSVLMAYLTHGPYSTYQGDGLAVSGHAFEVSIKLPPVPAGTYEIRWSYTPAEDGGLYQFYLNDRAMGIPQDFRMMADERINWSYGLEDEDHGASTDKTLRNNGYMRGPYSYCGNGKQGWSEINNCRIGGNGSKTRRAIIASNYQLNGEDNWLRIKSLTDSGILLIDNIELCPVSVYGNKEYTEDWY